MIRRLIIVDRADTDLCDFIRRDQVGDDTVLVIADRRMGDRRRAAAAHVPERRRSERRVHDVRPLLLAQGWAEVRLA